MFENAESFLLQARDLASAIGEAPKAPTDPNNAPPGMVRCACGKKNIRCSEIRYHNSDFLRGITDNICGECLKDVGKHAVIACVRCKAVVARIAPDRYKTGFVIKANGVYHTNACPNCVKDVESSVLIEKVVFDRNNGFAVNPKQTKGF